MKGNSCVSMYDLMFLEIEVVQAGEIFMNLICFYGNWGFYYIFSYMITFFLVSHLTLSIMNLIYSHNIKAFFINFLFQAILKKI